MLQPIVKIPPDHPLILNDYDSNRHQPVPLRLLENYKGYLQADRYAGYDGVGAWRGGVVYS